MSLSLRDELESAAQIITNTDAGGDLLTQRVRAAYFSDLAPRGAVTWAAPSARARVVMRAFELAAGRGIDVSDGLHTTELSRATGIAAEQLRKMACDSSQPFGRPLRRNPDAPKRLQLWTCPGCGLPLTFIVRTAETAHVSGLVCEGCAAMADGTPLPRDYFQLWDASGASAVTVVSTPDQYPSGVPGQGGAPQIDMAEACLRTGLPSHVLRTATANGTLPCIRRGGTRERWFDPADLDDFTAKRRRLDSRSPVTVEPPDGYLTLRQASEMFHVPVHVLRRCALETPQEQPPLRYTRVQWGVHGAIAVRCEDIRALGEDWLRRHRDDVLRMRDAVAMTGLTEPQLRGLISADEIPYSRSDRGTALFDRLELEAWLEGPGRVYRLLTPKSAADLAGCTPDDLRRANRLGELAAQATLGGVRRYDRDDVLSWATMRPTRTPDAGVPGAWLTPAAAASLAGCTPEQLRRASRTCELVARRAGRGPRRYETGAVLKWAASTRSPGPETSYSESAPDEAPCGGSQA